MPDARGNFKGVALNGKAAESWERIFGQALKQHLVAGDGYLKVSHDPAPGGAGSKQD